MMHGDSARADCFKGFKVRRTGVFKKLYEAVWEICIYLEGPQVGKKLLVEERGLLIMLLR